jgi:hypothetical protein
MSRSTAVNAAAPVWRRTPSLPIIVAGSATGALLWWQEAVDGDARLVVARGVAVAIAAASAMVVEDPSESISDVTPFGRPRRRLLAVAITGLVAAGTWAAVIGLAARLASTDEMPFGSLSLEFAGLCVLGWTLGYGMVAAFGPDGAGARSTFAVPIVVMCSYVWPWTREHLWESAEHTRNWIALIAVGAAVGSWCSRDTATRRLSM